MVQISVQAVIPKPDSETFLKLDLEYKRRIGNKKSGKFRKQHIIIFTRLFISSWPAMPKKSTDPLKIWNYFQLWQLFKVAQSYPHGPKLAQLTAVL